MADGSPTPTEQLEQLTSLYERHAYIVWNVALRTAMDRQRAMEAARRAFLGQVAAPDEARLAPEAARFATEVSQPVDTRSVEDPVLAATARLAAVQRAVLALRALSGGEHAGTFGLDAPTEQEVHRRANEQLATLLALQPDDAGTAYEDLPWEEPPEEIWQQLYPELHAAVTKHARTRQPETPTEVLPGAARRRWSAPRIPRAALVPVAVLAIAGVAWAASGGGSGSAPETVGTPAQPGSPAPAPGASGGSAYSGGSERIGSSGDSSPALSAEELDRLRREEIEDLKRFTARKEDRSLPPRARRRAAQKVDDLVELAQARQRAAERRELALRRALARERAARMREENRRQEEREDQEEQSASEPERPAPRDDEPSPQRPESRDKPDRDAPSDDEAQAECLYDEGSGAYICPE